ncbi:MAG: hypothetical protein COW18_00345 [Zetaproteobacteria bacterium CG12_big_fil_rev_8_21_14_0_65_54_13]|nr:MAG: hypothetical protein COX55_05780 [Zetaproteobacteria bacterium CG23_combo_of_CG06-09_8_20_14_all_54_7]PIW51530.1 MAG: hypothetical protein COW18_00345 [Zetaproteobacteria bacterium CG12_big_fil_rev_8_21_14_0_65_54_13]PIX53608.1 MAG: hypothetical protein COZ50_12060 [Zetaproteobacteria bacterium CG_4_10_14_3_um_filter_54_28]PJA27934.1 MAG: hypothetical protein CO188_11300 [Zetaproteobacteria bacterium CG_4_9_14_3_um_filter_54_145]
MSKAAGWVEHLGLVKHPEGGWYKEVYRSAESVDAAALPERFDGKRCFSTSIYFLLSGDECSHFHRIKQDELWHFYDGDGLSVHVIDAAGNYTVKKLGRHPEQGEAFQQLVAAGDWFGAQVTNGGYALVGCTVAPGFDFADFEMADRHALLARFPQHRTVIERLSRT